MFNLNRHEKYKTINNKQSIYCRSDLGPWTYCFGFRSNTKMRKVEHQGLSINNGYENGSNILKNSSLKTEYINLMEVEVYKIII